MTLKEAMKRIEELERRLRARDKDGEQAIRQRLSNAAEEIAHVGEFDYVIINDVFDQARADLAAVVRAARNKLGVQRLRHAKLFEAFRIP